MDELKGTSVQVPLCRKAFISADIASRQTLCLFASVKLVGSVDGGMITWKIELWINRGRRHTS